MGLAGLFHYRKVPFTAAPEPARERTRAELADLWFAVNVPPVAGSRSVIRLVLTWRIGLVASLCLALLLCGIVVASSDLEAFWASVGYNAIFWSWFVWQKWIPTNRQLEAWTAKYHLRPLEETMDTWFQLDKQRLVKEAVQRAGFTVEELVSQPVLLLNDSRRYEAEGLEAGFYRRGFDEVERTNWYRAFVIMMGTDRFVITACTANLYAGRNTEGESFGGLYRDIISLAQTGGGWNVILRSGLSVYVSYSESNRASALEAYVRLSNLKDLAEQRAGEEMGRIWRN